MDKLTLQVQVSRDDHHGHNSCLVSASVLEEERDVKKLMKLRKKKAQEKFKMKKKHLINES